MTDEPCGASGTSKSLDGLGVHAVTDESCGAPDTSKSLDSSGNTVLVPFAKKILAPELVENRSPQRWPEPALASTQSPLAAFTVDDPWLQDAVPCMHACIYRCYALHA